MPQYVCPACKSKLSLDEAVPPGTLIGCAVCNHEFAAPAAKAAKPAAAKPAAAKPAAPAAAIPFKAEPPPAAPPAHGPVDDFDDSNPYAVQEESEEEKRLAEVNKPKFGDVKDKFAKSARGPAMSLLVMPSNIMLAEGGLTALFGLVMVVVGAWPLIFTEATPSDEEIAEQLRVLFIGVFLFMWGSIICYSVSQMQNLGSYSWAVAGSIIAVLPLLAGVFALITLRDPRVIAGFKEPDTGPIKTEKKDEEEDEDDEEEDRRPRKRRK